MALLPRPLRRIRLTAAIQQQIDTEPTEPIQTLFFLNEPPRQPNTRYIILTDGIIEPDKIIMA